MLQDLDVAVAHATDAAAALESDVCSVRSYAPVESGTSGLFLPWQMRSVEPAMVVPPMDVSEPDRPAPLTVQAAGEDEGHQEQRDQMELQDELLARMIQESLTDMSTQHSNERYSSPPLSPLNQMAPASAAPVPHPTAPSILQRARRLGLRTTTSILQTSCSDSQESETSDPKPPEPNPESPSNAQAPSHIAIPDQFLCSITGELMKHPVATADGHVYEQAAIERWLLTHDSAPLTGLKLAHKQLMPIFALKTLIEDFRKNHNLPD